MQNYFGTGFRYRSGNESKEAFDAAGPKQAQEEASDFTRGALRVVDAAPKDIRDGARLYLALKNVLKQEGANAITIDGLGGLKAKSLPGYPYIAWSKFNGVGLCGGHENGA